jgi:YegS/Rv2252/BmrU family lipid kinase
LKTLFIVNPHSGKHKSPGYLEDLIRRNLLQTRLEYKIAFWESPEQVNTLVQQGLEEGIDLFVAVGGDGTVHHIGCNLIQTNKMLGIVPTGSGNGIARHLGIPLNLDDSIRNLQKGKAVNMDTATANGIPFIGMFGMGFDADIAVKFDESKVRGFITYLKIGIKEFFSSKDEFYLCTSGTQKIESRAFLVAVANTGQYGNNAIIAPSASVLNNKLTLCLLKKPHLVTAPWAMFQLFTGQLKNSSWYLTDSASHWNIKRAHPGPVHLDGEYMFMDAEVEVKVVPESLKVWIPGSKNKQI